jgi:hypothetical protein
MIRKCTAFSRAAQDGDILQAFAAEARQIGSTFETTFW